MRRLFLVAAILLLATPAEAGARTTDLRAFSTVDDRPPGYFRTGDVIHVIARNFLPRLVCGASAQFTLVDSGGTSYSMGSARPSFGNFGAGLVERDLEAVPTAAKPGRAVLKSRQECRAGSASGRTDVVIIDPTRPLPKVTATTATDALANAYVTLSFRLDRDAYVTIALEYEIVSGVWLPLDVLVNGEFVDRPGRYLANWRAAVEGEPVPAGHYRFRLTPRAPGVGDGAVATQGFYVARAFGSGTLSAPTGAAVSPDGGLYVADTMHDRVVVFRQQDGFAVRTISTNLSRPTDVAFGPTDLFATFIANAGTHRLARLVRAEAAVPQPLTGSAGSGPGQFSPAKGPRGIAVSPQDGGLLYAVDGDAARVQAFDLSGTFRSMITGGGMNDPESVAVAPDGSLWIADPAAGKLLHFAASGALLGQVTQVGGVALSRPVGVDVTPSGRILVVTAGSAGVAPGIFVLDGVGALVYQFRSFVQRPAGIASAGRAGDFYVVDNALNRVLWFRVP